MFETPDLTIYFSHLSFHFRADDDVQRSIESFSKINTLVSLHLLSKSNSNESFPLCDLNPF